jgi:predicted RNA methylase
MRIYGLAMCVALICAMAVPAVAQQPFGAPRAPDVIYVPTPQLVVRAMLKAAQVTAKDVIYDLGSGDGRIPITAAKHSGARGIGIDIDPQHRRGERQCEGGRRN